MRDERFGRLLKAALGSIVAHEGTTAPVVEAELGERLGLAPASIQRYKAGHIPPDPRSVALLAAAGVRRGFLNSAWLRAFLGAARYPHAAALVGELCPDAGAAAPAPPRPPADNLPAPTYPQFVPRAAAEEVLDGLRQRTAAVLITGLGGVGKTSLAREVAGACLRGGAGLAPFAAAVWVSDQDAPGTTTLDGLLAAVARTLDEPGLLALPADERRRAVEALLRRERVLLVVDQCETITDAALLAWLPRLPEPSKALLTSRVERPELRQGCWLVPLGGLGADEAAAFLAQQLRARKLEGRVDEPRQLDGLLAATGGNPQALALAFGELRLGARALPQLVADLAAARGEIVEAILARSWALLDADARALLECATLFHAPCAPEALLAAAGLDGGAAGRALAQLMAGALLDVRQPDLARPPRLGLHPLVRAFAGASLDARPAAAAAARARQLRWYADLAAEVGYCWDDPGRLARLDPEQETLLALLRWGLGAGAALPDMARLVRGADYYCYIRGLWALAPELAAARERAARDAGDRAEAVRARAYQLQMACRTGRPEAVEAQRPELEALRDDPGLPDEVRFEVAYTLALAATLAGRHGAAAAAWEAALPLARGLPVRAAAVARGWLAICHYRAGAPELAGAIWAAVLRDAAAGGFPRGVASSRLGLARLALDRGELAEAEGLLEAARAGAQGDGALLAEGQALAARLLQLRGDRGGALAALADAQERYRRLGMPGEAAEAARPLDVGGEGRPPG